MDATKIVPGIPPDLAAEFQEALDDLAKGIRRPEKMQAACERMDRMREENRQLFHALKLERVVTAITIGLIELVGALNILITLTMIVLTKYKDVAVMMSMGARRGQIRRDRRRWGQR